MFFIYLFIFWKNKNNYYSVVNPYFMNKRLNNELIIKKNEFLINNTKSYLKEDGFDKHCNKKEMDISIFIKNKKKIDNLNYLLSNSSSLHNKFSLIQKNEKKIYAPNLLGGGFFKDSDFTF